MKHIVLFSGGVNSWAAAKRIAQTYGTEDLTLLFTDTKMEDEDLYRFLKEAAANVGGRLEIIADGRTPWQVFFDAKFLGNARVDNCSSTLKRRLARKWINQNCDPADCVIYMGIDWTEEHRHTAAISRWAPFTLKAPLCEEPLLTKNEIMEWCESEGIAIPRLYKLGFPHNNCGGFCIKAGKKHFLHLLDTMPARFKYHEDMEQQFRETFDKDVSILSDRRNGQNDNRQPYTLKQLRIEKRPLTEDEEFDWGGCGCFDGDDDSVSMPE